MCQSDSNQDTDSQLHRLMIGILPFLLLSVPFVYADTAGFEEPISGVFDWINDVISANIESTNLPPNTETNVQNALDSGTEAGKKGTSLWFAVHAFFVDLIFAGVDETDIPIDKDIIVIISMILVALLVIMLLKKLLHENMKIGFVVVVIVVAIALAGITIEF